MLMRFISSMSPSDSHDSSHLASVDCCVQGVVPVHANLAKLLQIHGIDLHTHHILQPPLPPLFIFYFAQLTSENFCERP